MNDEYNSYVITNDNPPKNAYASVTIKNDISVAETKKVSELSEKVIEESGSLQTAPLAVTTTKAAEAQKISTAVSQVTVTASAVTVVAAVVAVAVVTTTSTVATVAAPLAQVTGAGVKYYNYGSDVCIEFVLEDGDGEIESLYAWIEDDEGEEITCEITTEGGAYLADAELAAETSGELTFVVYCVTNGGWEGELYRGAVALPAAPEIGFEYTTEYNADSGELTINYLLYDEDSQLNEYAVQLFDDSGNAVESTVNYDTFAIILNVTDGAELYLTIIAEAANGWQGEIINEAITVPSAPDVTVSEVWDEGWYEEGGEAYMYVYFSGNTTDITLGYWFEDDYGNIIACEFVEETEEYVCVYAAFDGSVDFTLDEKGRLSFVVSATTADGWTGELYREKYVIEPVAPDVEVTDVTVAAYSYDTTLTVQFTVEDINGEIAEYDAWYKDANGKIAVCELTQDGYTITATADVSGIDVSGGLILRVYVVTNDGWYGYLNDSDLILPTAPDAEAEVLMDNMYESYGVIYININYTGDTSVISAYEYWFEDEDGNKYVFDLGGVDDGAVSGSADFSAEDNLVLDTYGRMDFVIAVTTADGWQGEIYREKFEISSNGYLTYPELTGVTINHYETDFYTEMQITVYDPDNILTALYITLTDANTSLDLTGGELSVEIGDVTDADGITTFTVFLYDTTITPLEDGTINVYLLADLTVDDITTESVLADAYYTVTVII